MWERRNLVMRLQVEELQLELMLVKVEQLKAEKERLALSEEVRLLESRLAPPQLVTQPDPWTEPPPQEPTEPPWTEPPPQEPRPTPAEEIAQRIGLSLPLSSSLGSES